MLHKNSTAIISANEKELLKIGGKIRFRWHRKESDYMAIGQLLNEARHKVPHGAWKQWIGNNTKISTVTASRMMRIASMSTILSPVKEMEYSKISLLLSIPKNELDDFVNKLHVINGAEMYVGDMSRRQIEAAVKAHKQILATPLSEAPPEELGVAQTASLSKFHENFKYLTTCIDSLLEFIMEQQDFPESQDDLSAALRVHKNP